jgi:hypothetical protein
VQAHDLTTAAQLLSGKRLCHNKFIQFLSMTSSERKIGTCCMSSHFFVPQNQRIQESIHFEIVVMMNVSTLFSTLVLVLFAASAHCQQTHDGNEISNNVADFPGVMSGFRNALPTSRRLPCTLCFVKWRSLHHQ